MQDKLKRILSVIPEGCGGPAIGFLIGSTIAALITLKSPWDLLFYLGLDLVLAILMLAFCLIIRGGKR